MIKKWRQLRRLICASAVVGALLFPSQVMAYGGVEVSIPVSVTLENASEAADTEFEVTISAETSEMEVSLEELMARAVSLDGVVKFEILAG